MRLNASILLFTYLLGLLAPVGTLLSFKLNQEEIAREFCENKDKPKLNCEGKCHLSKILAEQSNDESEESTLNIEVDYPVGKVNLILVDTVEFNDQHLKASCYLTPKLKELSFKIDRPPQFL